MTTLNCCVLHSLQQRFPCRSSKTKCLAHASPSHFMIGTTSSNLVAKQLGFPSDTIMLAIPQVNDQWVISRHFVFVLLIEIFFPWLMGSSMMTVFVSIDHTTPSGREPSPEMIAISEGNGLSFLGMSTHSKSMSNCTFQSCALSSTLLKGFSC